jgi:hypothetical protein
MKRWPDCLDCGCKNEGVCGFCSMKKTTTKINSKIALKKMLEGVTSYSEFIKIYLEK